jgi:hypothetical protein
MDVTSKRKLLEWVSGKLSDERRSLETLHKSLVDELQLKLEAVPYVQTNGTTLADDKSLLCIAPAGGDAPSQSAGKAPLSEAKKMPNGDQDLAQITPQDAVGSTAIQPTKPTEVKTIPRKASHSNLPTSMSHMGDDLDHSTADIFQKIVMNRRFEWIFGLIIFTHIIIMTAEAQYVGLGVGYDLGFPRYAYPKEDVWPGGELVFKILDIFFGTLYTIELVLKILGLRARFLEAWNILDVAIVGMWYVDMLLANIELPIDTMLFRLLRLAKLLRLVKVLHSLTGFEQLFLMLTALKGSMRILCWVTILLFTCLISFALLLNQMLVSNVLLNDEIAEERKMRTFQYFGTFSRSLFSMFEMTLANWTIVGRFLMEDVSEFVGVATILFKLTMGFTVIAVINGCFIKETFKLAEQDDLLMIMQKDKDRRVHTEKMLKLLEIADTKGDGTLTRQEFINVCKNPEVDKWLGAQGLRVTDAGAIFDLIDSGQGMIHKQELVAGARKLQGNARSLDLAKNHVNMVKDQERMADMMMDMHGKIDEHSKDFRALYEKFDAHASAYQASQASTASGMQASTDMSGIGEFKESISWLTGEMKEVKKMLSACLMPPPPVVGMSQGSIPQVPVGMQASNPKVLWGCA